MRENKEIKWDLMGLLFVSHFLWVHKSSALVQFSPDGLRKKEVVLTISLYKKSHPQNQDELLHILLRLETKAFNGFVLWTYISFQL